MELNEFGKLTERHIQAIWYDGSLRPRKMIAQNGESVEVVDPGRWNLESGPDFMNATLLIGNERRVVKGDVEVHICPRDWDFHGHGTDPKYNNVIAHVTWADGEQPKTLREEAVSIWLGRCMTPAEARFVDAIDISAYPHEKPNLGRGMLNSKEMEGAVSKLLMAGKRRIRMKARRIQGRLLEGIATTGRGSRDNRRQLFYEEMMTTFGYKNNAAQFRHVAERVPLDALPLEMSVAKSAFLVAGDFEEWNRGNCRPLNSPRHRLEAAAGFWTMTESMETLECNDFTPKACEGMVKRLCEGGFVGKGRAGAMVANVVLPFALAEGRVSDPPDWLPPEELSSPMRERAWRIFGRDHNRTAYSANGMLMQGLLAEREVDSSS